MAGRGPTRLQVEITAAGRDAGVVIRAVVVKGSDGHNIYERDDVFTHAAKLGEYMQARLRELEDHPLVGEVRGRGLLAAVELVRDKQTGAAFPAPGVGGYAQRAALEQGLIVRAIAGSALAFCPPLVITKDQVDEMLAKTTAALDQTLAHCRSQGLLAG